MNNIDDNVDDGNDGNDDANLIDHHWIYMPTCM